MVSKNKNIIFILICLIAFVFISAEVVFAHEDGIFYKLKTSYLEIQETSYPQNIPLTKKENGKEEIVGSAKIVDEYLISDLPENEFLDEYPDLKSGFQNLTLSIEASEPIFDREDFHQSPSFWDNTKSFFGFETIPEYRITKEVDKSASVKTEIDLRKIKVETHYEELGIRNWESGTGNQELGIKQILTFTNNSGHYLNLSLLLQHRINTDKIYWNEQEYFITENPQRFVSPDRISFYVENGKAFYDFSDIPDEFSPELWTENKNSQNFLILSLNVFLSVGETKTIDPYYYITNSGIASHSTAYNNKTSLVRRANNELWQVYHRNNGGAYQIYAAYSSDEGKNWTEEQITFQTGNNNQYNPAIAIDHSDNIHLVWRGQGWEGNPDYYNIQYRRKTADGWKEQEAVTYINYDQYYPSMVVDDSNNVYIVWSGNGWGQNLDYQNIQYRKRTADGWLEQEAITDKNKGQEFPAIAVDNSDNIHIVWRGQGWGGNPDYYNIQYRQKTEDGWQEQEAITNTNRHDQYSPSIVVDNDNNVHIVWNGSGWGENINNKNINVNNIQYRKKTADDWLEQESVTDKGVHQYYPFIAIDNSDNIHIVWQGLGWGENPDYYNIQYRKKTNNAWQSPINITDKPFRQNFPSLEIKANSVFIVWTEQIISEAYKIGINKQ